MGQEEGYKDLGDMQSWEVLGTLDEQHPGLTCCLFLQRWFWLVRVLLSLFIGAEIVGECMV